MQRFSLTNRITPFLMLLISCSMITMATSRVVNFKSTLEYRIADTVPTVFDGNNDDLIASSLKHEAAFKFQLHQLPQGRVKWNSYKAQLKSEIIKKTGALVHQNLSLNLKETGSLKMKGYTIKNIAFQTRPGIYATANLYVPDGEASLNDKVAQEKFPGVIVMMGHSLQGRLYDKYQSVGISLALNGYVSLCIDPWGAGERTTIHGAFEDHGDENNLGAALMNVGESLMGMQITDNIRGVDLLTSLPYVDKQNIGATGSSGGGNQTIWLTAMDERIKAAVPVVSAGTFESFVMGSPCICEVLIDGLTFTEEAGVLALIAPRAIKMCNHQKDVNAAFNPREMLRSYKNAKPIFKIMGAENNIAYDTFNLIHGYYPEDREAMLGWFNLHLKKTGDGAAVKEMPFNTLPYDQLMVFAKGKRDAEVMSTEEYCKRKGNELRTILLDTKSFNADQKRNELRNILRINEKSVLKNVHEYPLVSGWNRFALETSNEKLIPVSIHTSSLNSKKFVIITNREGKENISAALIEKLIKSGSGIAIVDLSGTGKTASASLHSYDSVGKLRTLSKSYLLLGKTAMGEWVKEITVVIGFIKAKYKTYEISLNGTKETGLAGLFLSALEGNIKNVTLQDSPVSYLFDNRESIEYFSTCVNLPGFLNWGDISLAAALAAKNITFISPRTMSGRMISGEKFKAYKREFEQMRMRTHQEGKTIFQ